MKPVPSDKPIRPWERVRPSPPPDRRSRETFQAKAPSPVEQVLALHDEELDEEEVEAEPTLADSDPSDTVICF